MNQRDGHGRFTNRPYTADPTRSPSCVIVRPMANHARRRNLRLPGRGYAAPGSYFVTITTVNHADLFGTVVSGQVRLNVVGELVAENWRWLPTRYPHLALDEWCLMPNHLHGIVVLTTAVAVVETSGVRDDPGASPKPLGRLIGAFKTRSTNQVNCMRQTPGAVIWHRNYWDRVIRDGGELARIRDYIRGNPGAYRPRSLTVDGRDACTGRS